MYTYHFNNEAGSLTGYAKDMNGNLLNGGNPIDNRSFHCEDQYDMVNASISGYEIDHYEINGNIVPQVRLIDRAVLEPPYIHRKRQPQK